MPKQIRMPKLSDTMEEGRLIAWRKKVGDAVKRGEVIAEIETDKADMEFEAYTEGVVAQIVVEAGATVPVGTLIAVLRLPGESAEALAAATGPAATAVAAPTAAPKPAAAPAAKAVTAPPKAAPPPKDLANQSLHAVSHHGVPDLAAHGDGDSTVWGVRRRLQHHEMRTVTPFGYALHPEVLASAPNACPFREAFGVLRTRHPG